MEPLYAVFYAPELRFACAAPALPRGFAAALEGEELSPDFLITDNPELNPTLSAVEAITVVKLLMPAAAARMPADKIQTFLIDASAAVKQVAFYTEGVL